MNEKLPRKQRNLIAYRQEILEAAVNMFYRQTFHGTTVQEIAQEAELGVGTIYRIFPNGKDEIYQAIQESVVEDFEIAMEESMDGATGEEEIIRAYIRAAARMYSDHRKEIAIYLRGTAGLGLHLGKGLSSELAERYLACADNAAQALARGMEKGLFRRLNPDDSLLFLRSTINAFLMRWVENDKTCPIEESISTIETVFFHGVKI